MPRWARWTLLIVAWGIAIPLAGFMFHQQPIYTGPPIELDFNGYNPRGDRMFLEKPSGTGAAHDPNHRLAGLHPVFVWSDYYHALMICEDAFHNFYANEHDAKLGILDDPGRYAAVHPKAGRNPRGCWHMLGILRQARR